MSTPVDASSTPDLRPVLPSRGVAVVKQVLSGDTVILLGKATSPDQKAPEVVFTFEKVSAPRIASKVNNQVDEGGAFLGREWLRKLCVGKPVTFETRKQGATAGDRVYGVLYMALDETHPETITNLAVECVREGFGSPKVYDRPEGEEADEEDPTIIYEKQLKAALQEAQAKKRGIHADVPFVRNMKNAGESFEVLSLVDASKKLTANGKIKCVIEYVFDGSRFRCHVTDPNMGDLQYGSFTLLVGGIQAPRLGNPQAIPPTVDEPFSQQARNFVETRLLQRELEMTLHGTDKSGVCVVGTIHHPRGNIAVELLKNGLAKMSDWSVRIMNPMDVPALRIAENGAKRTNTGVWRTYATPTLSGGSEIIGTVVEVITGDTVSVLPNGVAYNNEECLRKISLASVRAPRVGNERMGRSDEPMAHECKERLRTLTAGKSVKIQVHYERDVPLGESTEKRQFGTISVGKREDLSLVLVSEGLAVTQRHREDDEKSPRYDELVAAEAVAKAAKKGMHSEKEFKKGTINDLTDPRKAKSYSGSLMRAGTLKAVVEFVFNGGRFKLLIPSENCHIVFAPDYLRCPQPSSNPGAKVTKAAEPFGDASKRHARLSLLQRQIEITCNGVTNGGVITGSIVVGAGGQRRDYALEMVGAGLATVDQRKIDYGEAPKNLVEAQMAAQANKVGVWSLEQPTTERATPKTVTKSKEEVVAVRISEIRSGNHFFFRTVGDESAKVMDDSMQLFTQNNGKRGAACDVKVGKVVAALFDGSWYRAKILERRPNGTAMVLYVDHGNVGVVPISTHLRPLDLTLGIERVPAVAKEAQLALTITQSLEQDEGVEAAHTLQSLGWGKDLTARIFCEYEGKLAVTLTNGNITSINEALVSSGLARVAKQSIVDDLQTRVVNSNGLLSLAAELNVAQDIARKTRSGMWRYGDVGDDDEDER